MHYAVPDSRSFITKGEVKTKAQKTETYLRLEQLFQNYSVSAHTDEQSSEPMVILTEKKHGT